MKLTDGLILLFTELASKVVAIGHRTGWHNSKGYEDGEPIEVFMFFTTDIQTATKAKAALDTAGVLCDTDLGPSKAIPVEEER